MNSGIGFLGFTRVSKVSILFPMTLIAAISMISSTKGESPEVSKSSAIRPSGKYLLIFLISLCVKLMRIPLSWLIEGSYNDL